MIWLRALMLMALIAWIGGIIFFAFVVAPTLFTVLPNAQLAGDVVSPTLNKLHWIGLVSGVVFLLASIIYNRQKYAQLRLFTATHVLVVLMLALTAVSQFAIAPRMRELRAQLATDSTVPIFDPSGNVRRIPQEKASEALAAGGQRAITMRDPQGILRYVPESEVEAAKKAHGVVVDTTATAGARRAKFDSLHAWSTRSEGGVLFLALLTVISTARRLS